MKTKSLNKPLRKLASTLCTVGAAIFGAGAARDHISRVMQISEPVCNSMLIIGAVLIGLGLLTYLASLLDFPSKLILENVVYKNLDSKYLCVYASQMDLHRLRDLYTEYFGSEVPSLELMGAWIKRYRKAFSMVYRVDDSSIRKKKQTLVGSFKLLRLTEDAVRALEGEELSGSTFQPEHIAKRQRDAAGCYVGDVIGTTRFAQGVLLGYLNAACEEAIRKGLPIYARPLTNKGKRVMTKHGFVQVADGKSPPEIGKICKLVISKFDLFSEGNTFARRRLAR